MCNTLLSEEFQRLEMKPDYLRVEQAEVFGQLVVAVPALKNFSYLFELRKGRSNFIENVQQFFKGTKVVTGDLFSRKHNRLS